MQLMRYMVGLKTKKLLFLDLKIMDLLMIIDLTNMNYLRVLQE